MKIVTRSVFLAMPEGTLYHKFEPMNFEDLAIKGETIATAGAGDFWLKSLVGPIEFDDTEEFFSRCDEAMCGQSIPLDLETECRDALFEPEQLFAVWETEDVIKLIARLQRTLP